MIYRELTPMNIIKLYPKYEIGLIRYLLINPCLISIIIWDDVIHEDLSCPTIMDKKIKTIRNSKVTSDFPSIWGGSLGLKINDQIWYSIKSPENIANRPMRAFPLYSSALIQLILNMEKYFDNY